MELQWRDEKLTRLLYRHRQVFAPGLESGTPCSPALEEACFIPEMLRFIKKCPDAEWPHPSGKTSFRITLSGVQFSVEAINSKSIKEALTRAYKFSIRKKDAAQKASGSAFHPKLAELMALVMIAMLTDKNVSVISLSNVNAADRYLYLCPDSDLENPITEAVQKLVLWLLLDPADDKTSPPDWYLYYPNTLKHSLFTKQSVHPYSVQYLREQGWRHWEFTGIDDQSEAEAVIGQCMNDSSSGFHITKLENVIKSEASKQMIYSYLIGKTNGSANRAMTLLKKNCRLRFTLFRKYDRRDSKPDWHDYDIQVSVSFAPPLSGVLRELEDALRHLSEKNVFSMQQYGALLRFLAVRAKKVSDHTVSLTDETVREMFAAVFASDTLMDESLYPLYHELCREKVISDMLTHLESGGILMRRNNKSEPDTVLFRYKDYRLLSEGAHYAYEFGRTNVFPEVLLSEDLHGDSTRDNRNHLTLRFNCYVVVAIGFLHYLDEGTRERVLALFLKYAGDFRAINRRIQMKAIFVLSYFLYDGDPLPIGIKAGLFRITFGSALYSFMLNTVGDLVLKDCRPYTDIMKATLDRSCVLVRDSEHPDRYYSQCDPFYFFWGGFIRDWRHPAESPEQKMKAAFRTQKEVWDKYRSATGWFTAEDFDRICGQLCEACEVIKAHAVSPNPQILPWIWAANALLFTIADFRNLMNQGEEFEEYAKDRMPELIEAAVLCDFYTRRYNRGYNGNGIDTPDVFLLCGAFRVVCAYSVTGSDFQPVRLPQGAAAAYSVWLSREKQIRYKALLYRLLSYTDYPVRGLKNELTVLTGHLSSDGEEWASSFLPYDRIPNCECFIENPRMLKTN